jgi:thioredoxin reductase
VFEWLIIGGGIHGCTIGNYLIKHGKTTIDELLIIDPHQEPMERWRMYTNRIGMEYLRSPSVHHIDVNPFSLQYFSRLNDSTAFYGRYKRPSLSLFNEHCETIVEEVKLKQCWEQGRVINVAREEGIWKVETDKGHTFFAKNLVLSISVNEQLSIPKWGKKLGEKFSKNVYHIFSNQVINLRDLQPPIVVVGGGITAAHTVIKLCSIFPGKVTLLSRHRLHVHDFDSNPGWLGPKYMKYFSELTNYIERREQIKHARHRGSMTKELYRKIQRLEKQGKICTLHDEVQAASTQNDSIVLKLNNGNQLITKTVLFATGFETTLPKEGWLKKMIETEQLRCANCGFPIVTQKLEWCPHLFVSGPLAELEIGPVARNISGARKAAERIVNNYIS